MGVKKEKKKPMSAAERKRKQRAKQSEDEYRLEENKRRRDKRAENPGLKTRQNARNARQIEMARSDPECRRRENSRGKHRKRMMRGPPVWHKNQVPWNVLNEAGKSAHHRKSWEECDALYWDEADAITKYYHERRLMAMGPEPIGRQCEPTRDYGVQAVVEGAGASEVNGRYRWVDWGTYKRSAMHNGEKVVFTLFSRKHHFRLRDNVEGDVCSGAPFVGGTFLVTTRRQHR